MSDIVYTIFSPDDPFYPFTKGPHTMIESGFWMELEGEGPVIAKHVAEDYFDDETWQEQFGNDDSAVVVVEVRQPEVNAGFYEVSLERVTKAMAADKLRGDPRKATP